MVINTMHKNIYTILMIIKKIKLLLPILLVTSCSLSPGMHMDTNTSWLDNKEYVYVDYLKQDIEIYNISNGSQFQNQPNQSYKIGNGDQITITVWGIPDVFPLVSISPEQNLRRVDSNGNIFFPYVGLVKASGKSQDQLRDDLTTSLSKFFTKPQLDVSIVKFNSQKVYLLGEVLKPMQISISDISLSLTDALGEASGVNNNTSSRDVFVIRQAEDGLIPNIYKADLSSPSGYLAAGNFYLSNNDIVYVNASGTTRWNKVISQFFPFSSFLNAVDDLSNSN